jgi:alpha-D-ribose 1-methylphosphonate 5-triphosphate synthase subunit PhnL
MNSVVWFVMGSMVGCVAGYLCVVYRIQEIDVTMGNIKKQEREMKELRIKMETCLEKLKKAQADIENR